MGCVGSKEKAVAEEPKWDPAAAAAKRKAELALKLGPGGISSPVPPVSPPQGDARHINLDGQVDPTPCTPPHPTHPCTHPPYPLQRTAPTSV
jgi:hypothetical protein